MLLGQQLGQLTSWGKENSRCGSRGVFNARFGLVINVQTIPFSVIQQQMVTKNATNNTKHKQSEAGATS
jgi:hypothetical protein